VEVDGFLRQWDALVERNPLEGFNPFHRRDGSGGQIGYLAATGELKVAHDGVTLKMGVAGNQAGKTEIGVVDDLIQCLPLDAVPSRLRPFKVWDPPFRCRVVTQDLGASLYDVLIPKWQRLAPREHLLGGSWESAFDKTLRVLRFQGGSQVQFMSAEQPREKHQGATLHRVRFDEEPPAPNGWGIYRESRMRVLKHRGEIAFNMTPSLLGGGLTWTYDEVWLRRNDPDVYVGQWSMRDNPYLPKAAIEQEVARCLTEAERRARVDGDFVSFRGRVLEELAERHLVDAVSRADIEGMDVVIGYDPGLTRGGVVWCAFDQANDMLVFDELYPQNLGVEDIVKQARVKNRLWGLDDPVWVVDPSQRIRSMATAQESVQTELHRLGVAAVAGENDRLAGVLQLKGRLQKDRLRVSRACTSWLREADRWLVAADEDTNESRPRSTAKGHSFATIGPDHLMDPTRYVAMARAWTNDPLPASEKRLWTPGEAPKADWLVPAPEMVPMGFMS